MRTIMEQNNWTGGQYSLLRVIFGAYLLCHFAMLLPWGSELFSNQGVLADAALSPIAYVFPNILSFLDAPIFVNALIALACAASVMFAIGWHDKIAALFLWYVWACLLGRNPLIANPSIPYVGWMLLAHLAIPAAPYGSWARRGNEDPGDEWRMPQGVFAVAWFLLAAGYSYSGYTKLISPSWMDGSAMAKVLSNPLARPSFVNDLLLALPQPLLQLATWGALAAELLFLPLALLARVRPWLWLGLLLMHFGLIMVIDFADLSCGMVLIHLLTFNPAWLTTKPASKTEYIFYDGNCGLCHRFVRFVLSEDRTPDKFAFAPLESELFTASVPEEEREQLPDSVVVLTDSNQVMSKSAGVIHVMSRLGGAWRVASVLLRAIPRPLRDFGYDFIARIRYKLFAPPPDACPILPARLRQRFSH